MKTNQIMKHTTFFANVMEQANARGQEHWSASQEELTNRLEGFKGIENSFEAAPTSPTENGMPVVSPREMLNELRSNGSLNPPGSAEGFEPPAFPETFEELNRLPSGPENTPTLPETAGDPETASQLADMMKFLNEMQETVEEAIVNQNEVEEEVGKEPEFPEEKERPTFTPEFGSPREPGGPGRRFGGGDGGDGGGFSGGDGGDGGDGGGDGSGDPLAFDLNRDGKIGVTGGSTAENRNGKYEMGRTVDFDLDGDGKMDKIEWMAGDGDGMLVDNSDGKAAENMDGTRLFGDEGGKYRDGIAKLKLRDANNDGKISGDELKGLEMWIDDGDAKVEAGEMKTLEELGITEISVKRDVQTNERGEKLMRSSAKFANGEEIMTEDVWFGVDKWGKNDPTQDSSAQDTFQREFERIMRELNLKQKG